MNVIYTQEEANAAIQLYDMAVKTNGMIVAEAALILTKKLQDAFRVPAVPSVTEETNEE